MRIIFLLVSYLISTSLSATQIAESENNISPLLNGQQIPSVITTTVDNQKVDLLSLIENKKTVLFFYRGGWCPFCNTQMGQLKAIENELTQLGFQLMGISTDSVTDLEKSIKDKKLNYQLVSDYHSKVSEKFGLAYFASQKVTDRYLAMMHLTNPLQKNKAGDQRLVLPAPAIYVVDDSGLVQFSYVNINYKVRLDEQLLLLAAKLVK
ncbi:MAG: AhpC/TSA family protein [Colwellia sp.]|nr:AhpC/TSA family protein [Colwellia sp.]